MGMCLGDDPATGPYSTEARRESFYLSGERPDWVEVPKRGLLTYTQDGRAEYVTVEVLIEDLPHLEAALAELREYLTGQGRAPATLEELRIKMAEEAALVNDLEDEFFWATQAATAAGGA